MNAANESLVAQLARESGLTRLQSERFLKALTGVISNGLKTSGKFAMPGVGDLVRAKAQVPDKDDLIVVRTLEVPKPRRRIKMPELFIPIQDIGVPQGTDIPPALSVIPDIAGRIDVAGAAGMRALAGTPRPTRGKFEGIRLKKNI